MLNKELLRRNVLSNSGATVVSSGTQLLLLFLLGRWLPEPAFALFVTATALIGIAEMASDFGGRVWAVGRFSLSGAARNILRLSTLGKVFFTSIFALLVVFVPFKLIGLSQVLLCCLIAFTQPSTDPLLWYLEGRERFDREAVVMLAWRVTNVFALAMCAWIGMTATFSLLAWLVINILRILVETRIPWIRPVFSANAPTRERFQEFLTASMPIGAAFLVVACFQRLGLFLLGQLGSVAEVAAYGFAFTLIASSGFVGTSITFASFPALSRAICLQDYPLATKIVAQKLALIASFLIPACFLGEIVAPGFSWLIYNHGHTLVARIIALLLPGLYISTVNFALKYVMNALSLNWHDVASVGVGVFCMTVMAYLPLPFAKSEVIAVSWGVSELCTFLIRWRLIYRDGRLRDLNLRHCCVFLLALTLASIAVYSIALNMWASIIG